MANESHPEVEEITHDYTAREIIRVLQETISYAAFDGWWSGTRSPFHSALSDVSAEFQDDLDKIPDGPDRMIYVAKKFSEINKGPWHFFDVKDGKLILTLCTVGSPGLEAALLKFSYYQDEIRKREWATSIELDGLLNAAASCFNSVISTYDDSRALHIYSEKGLLHVIDETRHLPGMLLNVEKYNYLRRKVTGFNESHGVPPVQTTIPTGETNTLSKHIVRLLQEIIVDGSQAIYRSQLSKISQINNDDRDDRVSIDADLVPLGDRLITLNGNALFSADPKTRYEVGWKEINDNLQQFALWQEELDGDNDPGMTLDIVQSKLLPLTVGILGKVASFLTFFTLDTRSDTPELHHGYSDIYLEIGNRLAVGGSLPQTTRDKANELDMLLFKLSKKVERLRLQRQLNGLPPASQPQSAKAPAPVIGRSAGPKKAAEPNDSEKVIIRAIKNRMSNERMCAELDRLKRQPLKSWLHDELYRWPGSYTKAWKSTQKAVDKNGRAYLFWHRRISVYKSKVKDKFSRLIESPDHQGD